MDADDLLEPGERINSAKDEELSDTWIDGSTPEQSIRNCEKQPAGLTLAFSGAFALASARISDPAACLDKGKGFDQGGTLPECWVSALARCVSVQ
jgi:hypothetical protein